MAKNNAPVTSEQLVSDLGHYQIPLVDGPDLAAVILATGYIEKQLGALLSQFLIAGQTADDLLDSIKGPIASLHSKSQLAYCLGLIPKSLFQLIQGLGGLRNLFAHSHVSLSFGDSEPAERIGKLDIPASIQLKSESGAEATYYPANLAQNALAELAPKQRFSVAVNLVINALLFLVPRVQRRERAFEGPGDTSKLAPPGD